MHASRCAMSARRRARPCGAQWASRHCATPAACGKSAPRPRTTCVRSEPGGRLCMPVPGLILFLGLLLLSGAQQQTRHQTCWRGICVTLLGCKHTKTRPWENACVHATGPLQQSNHQVWQKRPSLRRLTPLTVRVSHRLRVTAWLSPRLQQKAEV